MSKREREGGRGRGEGRGKNRESEQRREESKKSKQKRDKALRSVSSGTFYGVMVFMTRESRKFVSDSNFSARAAPADIEQLLLKYAQPLIES